VSDDVGFAEILRAKDAEIERLQRICDEEQAEVERLRKIEAAAIEACAAKSFEVWKRWSQPLIAALAPPVQEKP
jgi:hypothetical protein